MDTTTLIIVGAGGLIMLAVLLIKLNSAWGNFPTQAPLPPPPQPIPQRQPDSWDTPSDSADERSLGVATADQVQPDEFSQASTTLDLVPIQQPMVLRAVQDAMARNHPASRYFVQQGDQVYIDLTRISDPQQRQQADRLFNSLNGQGDIDMMATFKLIRQLFNS